MYYSSGNYEAFARPLKPEGVDHKAAYIIGTGLAALSAACYLVRDGQMKGSNVHIFEKDPLPGGACDGWRFDVGYVMRGGREMDNHFEVMWDLFRSIPSIETDGVSVLDEYYWLNKKDPNFSLCRATEKCGQDAHTDRKFAVSDKAAMEIMRLFFTPDEELFDKKIEDFFDDEVFNSNFWLYWRTMFAFQNWQSALEMKRYIKRYIHHIGGLPDFTALRFTKYNQYESMILPMIKYLEDHGVQFHYNIKVMNVEFDLKPGCKQATRIELQRDGQQEFVDLRTTWYSSPPAAVWRTPPWAVRTPPLHMIPRSAPAAAGICGGGSQPRTLLLATRTSSVLTRKRPTGCLRPWKRWTSGSSLTSRISASGIPSAAVWSPAASLPSRTLAG